MAGRTWPSARAFVGRRGEGVIYAPGVWHLPMVALGEPADFAMLMWETGDPAADCEVREIRRADAGGGARSRRVMTEAVTDEPEQKPSGRIA